MFPSAELWAGHFLNGVIAGTAIAALAWLILNFAGKQSATVRFGVWFSALALIALSPFGGFTSNAATTSRGVLALPASWAIVAIAVWAFIVTILLGRVAAGLFHLRTIRQNSSPISPAEPVFDSLRRTLSQFGNSRHVEVRVSKTLRVPTAIGLFRPLVIFPEWSLKELSGQELNATLLHELAHLRRYDDWTNLAQKLVRAVFFFHPAVWWIEDHLTLEREMACDDFVLARTDNAQAYAECLVSVAEKSVLRRGLAMAQAMAGRMRQTSQRIKEILDTNRSTASRGWKPGIAIVAILGMASAAEISHIPAFIAFQDATISAQGAVTAQNSVAPPPAAKADAIVDHRTLLHPAKYIPRKFTRRPATQKIASGPQPEIQQTTQVPALNVALSVDQHPAPPPMFVVMRSALVAPDGEVIWSVNVYRLTAFHPANGAMGATFTFKQI
jgi:beta-lactamase regulating signal transducer with metallopeptidase domain